jgi:hypothetical protein
VLNGQRYYKLPNGQLTTQNPLAGPEEPLGAQTPLPFRRSCELDLFFKNITVKVTAISLEGDFFAPQAAVDFLIDKYQNAEVQKRHLRPADHGVKAIGHFGIFREKFQDTLWQLLLGEVAR